MRTAALTRPASSAHRSPVQDHEISGYDVGDAFADGFDGARGLMSQKERVVVVNPAFAVGQIRVADPARQHVDHDFTGTRVRDHNVDELDGLVLVPGDDALHCLFHSCCPVT